MLAKDDHALSHAAYMREEVLLILAAGCPNLGGEVSAHMIHFIDRLPAYSMAEPRSNALERLFHRAMHLIRA